MNTIAYKGFDINQLADNRFYIVPSLVGFKADGYSTLNNAKGAITKRQYKEDAEEHAIIGILRDAELNSPVVVKSLPVKKSRRQREGVFAGKLDGRPVRMGKRSVPAGATLIIPVPSWVASAWQNKKYVAKKVGV